MYLLNATLEMPPLDADASQWASSLANRELLKSFEELFCLKPRNQESPFTVLAFARHLCSPVCSRRTYRKIMIII
jgi:hypothetical protein